MPPKGPRSRWRSLLFGTLGAACALSVGVFWGMNHRAEPPLHYQLVGGVSQGELISSEEQPARLSFNDGSSIETGKETTLNVQVVRSELVTRLVQGKLQVHKVAEPDQWRFLAGPHEVRTTGSRFDLSWDPHRSRLTLALVEGLATVHTTAQKPRRVTAGQVLILDESQDALHLAHVVEPEQAVGDSGSSASAAEEESDSGALPSWAQQVAAGRFEEIIRDAQRIGLKQAFARKSSTELVALAQAARYVRDANLTLQVWTAIRERFVGKPASTQAAFFLGRFYDQLGRSEDALTWFDTYLTEAPNGVYASESLGRKLVLVRSLQGYEQAREQAGLYLSRFPHGPHADAARDILLNE